MKYLAYFCDCASTASRGEKEDTFFQEEIEAATLEEAMVDVLYDYLDRDDVDEENPEADLDNQDGTSGDTVCYGIQDEDGDLVWDWDWGEWEELRYDLERDGFFGPVTSAQNLKGRRINYDDDIVVVFDQDGNEIYHGLEDYEPMKYEDWRWDNGCYRCNGYTKVCIELSKQVRGRKICAQQHPMMTNEDVEDAILNGRPFDMASFNNMMDYDPLEDLMDDALFDASSDFDYDPGAKAHFDAFMDHLSTLVRDSGYTDDYKAEARRWFEQNRLNYAFGV